MAARSIAALVFAAALATVAHGQSNELVFGVTEGVTYQATPKEIRDKFAPIAEVLAKATGRKVRTVLVPAYNDMRAGLASQEFDVAFIHPAHVSMAEIKAGRYKSVAWTSGYTEYTVSMLMPKDATLKSVDELKGRVLVTPDPDSITAAMVRAMFRADKIKWTDEREAPPATVKVVTTRYQDAVPFYIENGFAQVGATASNAVVKKWTDKGGKVLGKSRPVPIKQFIVASRLSPDEQQRIRDALVGLKDAKGGKEMLDIVGYRGFLVPNPEVELASIAYLGL